MNCTDPETAVQTLTTAFNREGAAAVLTRAQAVTAQWPHLVLGWQILAEAQHATGDTPGSVATLQHVLTRDPDNVIALNNLGDRLRALGRLAEAEAAFRAALARRPDLAVLARNLGRVLLMRGRPSEAEPLFRQILAAAPGDPDASHDLGKALFDQERYRAAEPLLAAAVRARPQDPEILTNTGLVQQRLNRPVQAKALFERALVEQPAALDTFGRLLFLLHYFDVAPTAEILSVARRFGAAATAAARATATGAPAASAPAAPVCPTASAPAAPVAPTAPLTVGFVSGDLRQHPVAHFLEGVVGRLRQQGVRPIAYPTTMEADAVTDRLRPLFEAWRPIAEHTDAAAAALIRADRPHILVDLAGHTTHGRLPVFAHRPAPVQVAWIGFPGTTGLAEMDYLLTDRHRVPESAQGQFTERVWYLPQVRMCFAPPAEAGPVAPLPALVAGHVTFGSFQGLGKVTDRTVALWAAVLARVPTARLRLQSPQLADPATRAETAARFQRQGVDPGRLDLHGPQPRAAYLQAHGAVDLILDTVPVTGSTTTCETLWMGVPTVTLAGERMYQRGGAGVMGGAGLPAFIAETPEAYGEIAVRWASDLPGLAALRAELRTRVAASPVMDAPRFAADLAAAFRRMVQERTRT